MRLAAVCLAAFASGFVGWTLVGFHFSEGIRWHQLHHHRLVGLPLYGLLSNRIPDERRALWDAQPRLVEPWERADAQRPRAALDAQGDAPHVVFLMIDTLRADALAVHGGERSWMPELNALAERSVVFENVAANASWTRASVASIFTGLLPEEHGAARYRDRLSESWTTLPEALSAGGYATAAFVSNWVQVGIGTGFAQGFDVFEELATKEEILQEAAERGGRVREHYARAADVNAAVLAWLDGAGEEAESEGARERRPHFLYLHYLDPHSPYLSGSTPGIANDPRSRKLDGYRRELAYLDGELARLFEELPRRLEGPIVWVITSDHGEEFWEHGEWGHGHALYRELVWVPTLVHRSGESDGVRIDAPLELRDLYDLVLALALPTDAPVDLPAWARTRARGVRYASQYLDRAADVRPDRRFTAMRRVQDAEGTLIWSAHGPSRELYEPADLDQERNVVDLQPGVRERLELELGRSVRYWTVPPRVERTAEDLEFLRALGYAGGAAAEPDS